MSGTMACPACGAFERAGTEKCFSCGARMDGGPTASPADERSNGEGANEPTSTGLAGSPGLPPPITAGGDASGYGYGPVGADGYGPATPYVGGDQAPGYGYGQGYGAYGTGYGPPPPGYQGYYGQVPPQADSGARTAMILGIVSLVICGILLGPAAILEGTKARKRIRESNGALTGDSQALAGIVCGSIAVAFTILYIAFVIWQSSRPTRVRF